MTDQTKATLAVLTARNGPASGSFGAFISSGNGLLPVASTAQNSAMVKAITRADTTLPRARVQHIIGGIHDILKSKEFIEELGDTIGQPHVNETEDEFVVRCKVSMRVILERKLSSL